MALAILGSAGCFSHLPFALKPGTCLAISKSPRECMIKCKIFCGLQGALTLTPLISLRLSQLSLHIVELWTLPKLEWAGGRFCPKIKPILSLFGHPNLTALSHLASGGNHSQPVSKTKLYLQTISPARSLTATSSSLATLPTTMCLSLPSLFVILQPVYFLIIYLLLHGIPKATPPQVVQLHTPSKSPPRTANVFDTRLNCTIFLVT